MGLFKAIKDWYNSRQILKCKKDKLIFDISYIKHIGFGFYKRVDPTTIRKLQ